MITWPGWCEQASKPTAVLSFLRVRWREKLKKKKTLFPSFPFFSNICSSSGVMVDGLSSPLSGSCIEVYTHIYYIYTIQACFYSGVIFWVFVTPEKRRRFRWCFQPQQQQKREDKKEKELHLLCRGKIYRFAITTMQLLYFVVYKWSRALTLSCGITSYNIYIYCMEYIYLLMMYHHLQSSNWNDVKRGRHGQTDEY